MRRSDAVIDPGEFVIDRKTGQVRQAGASQAMGNYVKEFRSEAEKSLYVFAKGVLGLSRLTNHLHKDSADFLQRIPPYRKLLLLPRDHLKTSICSRSLPIHILIQPKESNCYLPGRDGSESRVLLAAKTSTNAQHQLRWIEGQFENCDILRALWPHRCWNNPRKESRKWSESEMMIPRPVDFPEASIETIGVGGKVTGRHYDIMIKDDLVDIEDANSQIVMQTAIEWHKASRALMDDPDKGLEFILGTRWAVYDLYQEIIDNDPTVETMIRAAVEDGQPIFPEMFGMPTIQRLHRELGPRFMLLYMNNAANPELTDFDAEQIRYFMITADTIRFVEDERDANLAHETPNMDARSTAEQSMRGMRLNRETYDLVKQRAQYLRARAS
jgi:hypothetical protein